MCLMKNVLIVNKIYFQGRLKLIKNQKLKLEWNNLKQKNKDKDLRGVLNEVCQSSNDRLIWS